MTRDIEQARLLLAVARRDLRALRAMTDGAVFATEVFGFHAQQTVEKTLKAWLSWAGCIHPRTHDLDDLFNRLRDANQTIPEELFELSVFTDFAVTFRYVAFPGLDADRLIDRPGTADLAERLVAHVENLVTPPLPVTAGN